MRKIILPAVFFSLTPLILAISMMYLSSLSQARGGSSGFFGKTHNSVAFAALPTADIVLKDEIESKDARIESLRDFLKKHNSPLEDHSEEFVDAAGKYGIDYRLLPAIAMQESNLCKKAPKLSNNCWGFGVYGKKVTKFSDYKEAIDVVSKTLSEKYHSIGLTTPEEIMTKYTPSNDGEWAESVNFFMNQLY